jgi:photosystem II stability/assembly factor-like uncharacterized protein
MTRLLLLTLALFSTAVSAQSWEWLNPTPNGNSLSDIEAIGGGTYYVAGDAGTFAVLNSGATELSLRTRFASSSDAYLAFADPNAGWVATGDGNIYRTTDAGQSWGLQYESDRFAFFDASATDAQAAWAVGNASFTDRLVVRTADGGQTWAQVDYPRRDGAAFDGAFYIRAFDAQTAVVVDYSNTVYRTTNGGTTWDSTHVSVVPAAGYYEGAFFLDTDRGWIVGPNQTIAATTDGGRTWVRQIGAADSTDDGRHYFTEVAFADAQTGWATTFDCLYRTADGGTTWTPDCAALLPGRDQGALLTLGGEGFVIESGTLLRSTDGGDTFDDLTPGYRETLRSAAFLSDTQAWAVSTSGDVLRTTDGWNSFEVAYSDPTASFLDLAVADAQTGWAVGPGGAIRATTDGGSTWTPQTSGVAVTLSSVAALSPTSAVAVGNGGTILATTDGGGTWSPRTSGVTANLAAVHFADAQHGWTVGRSGTILATADGGMTWVAQNSGVLTSLRGVFFPTASTGYALLADGVLGTTDGGTTWALQPTPPEAAFLSSVFFLDDQTGWAGGLGTLIATTDGGATWELVPDYPFGGFAYDLYFASAGEGWVFGANGTVLGYSDASTAAEPGAPSAARLAVYPNPSAEAATLALALTAPDEVTVTVHDALGRAVAWQTLALAAGEHRLALPAGLAPGVYVVTATTDGEHLGMARMTVIR